MKKVQPFWALLLAAAAWALPGTDALKAAGAPLLPSDPNYRIAPADVLLVTVFQEEDLKSTLRVSNDGEIVFPLIGAVRVTGLSPQGAADAVGRRLASGYLINPQVNVTVLEFSKRRFTVLGQVQKPGSYDMPDQEGVTLLQAIGIAGGYTRIADPRKVTLMRRGGDGGRPGTFHFDAKRLAGGQGESGFLLKPGDVITVAESLF